MTDRLPFRALGLAALFAGFGFMSPAVAQMAGPGGLSSSLGPIGGTSNLHSRSQPQEIAPPALPGASGAGNVSAGPVTDVNGDPTKLLFKAINHGDYVQARAAVGRGANLQARNALGETPIELSVELNRDRITFMLLSARAEEAPSTSAVPSTNQTRPTLAANKRTARPQPKTMKHRVQPAEAHPSYPAFNDPGRPDPKAGFLGFGE